MGGGIWIALQQAIANAGQRVILRIPLPDDEIKGGEVLPAWSPFEFHASN